MRTAVVLALLIGGTVPAAAQTTAAPTTGYGAWFGTVPNMDNAGGGILINGTTAGSPAEKAGLVAGDRIMAIAGKPMHELRDLAELLRAKQPGDTVLVAFRRLDEDRTVRVVLGLRPGS